MEFFMKSLKWWQTAVFYQVYPRSFADGDGDGIGDFQGIIAKLDYLKDLGIDAIWLSPHFPSPQYDCGYDIADYTGVNPEYGTLAEFKQFLEEAHRREIKVVLDLVLNHSSDQHPWFLESRSSRDNPKRDWYIWRDAQADGSLPNNWYSTFGGSAWEFDAQTDSYYYHYFFKEQPDLNWRNPEVKQAMFQAVRFWLEMGVDGYRLDAIGTIYEDLAMPDQQAGVTQEQLFVLSHEARTPEEWQKLAPIWKAMYGGQVDQPGVHELMQELRALIDEYPGRVLVGETEEISYYGSGDDELHLVFNFPLTETERLTPTWVRDNQKTRLALLPEAAWPCNTLGNHDSPRVYTRFGDGKNNQALARQNLVLLLTLKGTPFLYNGEEIGMSDYLIEDISLLRDNVALFYYDMARRLGGMPEKDATLLAARGSRDKNRTPTQWANLHNAGFSPAGVTTWLPVNPDYASGVNVADQENDPGSLLNFYKAMLRVRRENPALVSGEYQPLDEESNTCLVFLRTTAEQRCLVVLNMTAEGQLLSLTLPTRGSRLIFSTHSRPVGKVDLGTLPLGPFEALIIELS
jgi:alpha-glucosidase